MKKVILLAFVLSCVPTYANVGFEVPLPLPDAVVTSACDDVYNDAVAKCRADRDTCLSWAYGSSMGASWCLVGYSACVGQAGATLQYCRAWMGE